MWVRRFSIEASTGGVWRSPGIAPLQCRNDTVPLAHRPPPRPRCGLRAHELPHLQAKGALMRRRSLAWWEDVVIAVGLWLVAVLALSARRRG